MPPRQVDRDIFRLALPALGALAADPLVSLVDTAWVGRIDAESLAALGVASAVFAIAFFLFNFLAYGTTPLVAGRVARGDPEGAGRLVTTALLLAAALGLITAVVLAGVAGPILRGMGAGADILDPGRSYLRIRALAVPAALVVIAGHGIYRGYQDTVTPLLVTIGLNVVNLVLDPILIFGADMGIGGAAWATVVAQWLGALSFLVLLSGREKARAPGWADVGTLLTAGRHLVVRTAALLATLTLATAVAARVGTRAVAAHQVAVQVWVFLALVVDAFAVAAQAMIGKLLGVDDGAGARRVADRLLGYGLAAGIALLALIWALAPVLPRLFSDEADVVQTVRDVYPFLVVMQPLNALVFVWDGIVIGAAAFRFIAGAMVAAGAVGCAVLLLVLPLDLGLAGVWWGITALMFARAATLAWWYWRPGSPLPRSPGRGSPATG